MPRKCYGDPTSLCHNKRVKELIKNLKNHIDFFMRSQLRWERTIPRDRPIPSRELRFQEEIREFLDLLSWEAVLQNSRKKEWVVADVGAKNFSLAPLIDTLFLERNCEVEIHGIELDAYRRLSDFYTRADYGRFFAAKARDAHFHTMDFMNFKKPSDILFLLNPFVTAHPLLSWGLPLKHFRPQSIFQHAYELLQLKRGALILSCPSREEFKAASEYALNAGFLLGSPVSWKPQANSLQKKPRLGRICYSNELNVSDSGNLGSA